MPRRTSSRSPGRLAVFMVSAVVATALASLAPADATHLAGQQSRQLMTDGGIADAWIGYWPISTPYVSPSNGWALTHLYFNFAQPSANVNSNLLVEGDISGIRGAWAHCRPPRQLVFHRIAVFLAVMSEPR